MFGITLATGLVVDDAIVVIENIDRHLQEGEHDPRKAASAAMEKCRRRHRDLSGAGCGIRAGRIFPRDDGILFRQFALTIAFSISISAFNALTLTPSLSALLLGRVHGEKGWFFRRVDKVIGGITEGYRRSLYVFLRFRMVAGVLFLAGLGLPFDFPACAHRFCPRRGPGLFPGDHPGSSGASGDYVRNVEDQVSAIMRKMPEVENIFAITGNGAPNRGIIYAGLTGYSQRKGPEHSAQAVVDRLRGSVSGITGALVLCFLPPAIQGLGQFGGFQYEVQDQGSHSLEELAQVTQDMVRQGNSRKDLTSLYSSYTASDPQFLVTIDREKAKSLHVPLQQITDTLGVYMGSAYVNDFDFNNRSYRVYVQADKQFRSQAKDLKEYYVRSDMGAMIPLENLATVTQITTPQVISHYNLFRSAEIDGSPGPGFSSGQAIAAMDDLSKKVLPQGFTYEWTGPSLEELASGRTTIILFGLGVLVVYLTLSAQYESFVLPFIVLLAVPMALLGALGAQALRGLQNDVYCQIGLVMLIGLSSKNAILIVEFAEQLRERGLPLVEATVEAARIRLRPILMTSFAFILGVVPLMLAHGAGQEGRHSVGTTVFGGMIMSTVLNLFFIPVLYLIIEGWRERGKATSHNQRRPPPTSFYLELDKLAPSS